MKQDIKREGVWIVSIILLTLILYVIGFDIKSIITGSTAIDINVHDTYLVLHFLETFLLIFSVLFFVIYLIRLTISKLKNGIVNTLYLISNSLIIIMLLYIGDFLSLFNEPPGYTIYPPLSNIEPIDHEGNLFYKLSTYIRFINIGLIVLQLTVVLFIMRMNRNNKATG